MKLGQEFYHIDGSFDTSSEVRVRYTSVSLLVDKSLSQL